MHCLSSRLNSLAECKGEIMYISLEEANIERPFRNDCRSSVVVSSELLSSVELSELSELELPEPLAVSV